MILVPLPVYFSRTSCSPTIPRSLIRNHFESTFKVTYLTTIETWQAQSLLLTTCQALEMFVVLYELSKQR